MGSNWHLFDTMEVIEHASGDTLLLATSAVDGYSHQLFASAQLDVGIPFPDVHNQETVTYGVIERGGYQIGYVYVFGWAYDAGIDFHAALDDLTANYETSGLIIDFRYNYGGNMFLSDEALGLLFAESVPTIDWFERCSQNEHLPLCRENVWSYYVIDPTPLDRFYDRPIAVLTGPGAVSSGDQVALRMTYHPSARVFGKSKAAAFNAPDFWQVDPEISAATAIADCARVDALDTPLTHLDFPVDVPIWLMPDDVALGIDTVVEAAAAWIRDTTVRVDDDGQEPDGAGETPDAATHIVGARPNPFNPTTELVVSLAGPTDGTLAVYDLSGRLVRAYSLRGLAAGEHVLTWNGQDAAGRAVPTGAYLVRLETELRLDAKKVMLLR